MPVLFQVIAQAMLYFGVPIAVRLVSVFGFMPEQCERCWPRPRFRDLRWPSLTLAASLAKEFVMGNGKILGVLAVAGVVLLGCAGIKLYRHVQSCEPRFDDRYVYLPAAKGAATARVILIPGMDGTAANFLSIPLFQKWASGLAVMGADVVVLNTPIPKTCWFADGGRNYRALFLRELDDVMASASSAHGRPTRTIIAGVSYGGIHAMMGYAAHPHAFVGWEASLSVTKLAALQELQDAGPVPAFDPFAETAVLKGSQGYLTWGGRDHRVDHRLTEALYSGIKSPAVIGKGYAWLGHETTSLTIADVLADARRQLTVSTERLSGR